MKEEKLHTNFNWVKNCFQMPSHNSYDTVEERDHLPGYSKSSLAYTITGLEVSQETSADSVFNSH